jgi:hypothetical protein
LWFAYSVSKEKTMSVPHRENTHQSFIDINERRTRKMSPEDLDFWHGQPPQKIICASSSVRKGVMLAQLLSGLSFAGEKPYLSIAPDESRPKYGNVLDETTVSVVPLDLNKFLDSHIYNGDGAMNADREILLGYFHGVPVYMVRTEGETQSNEVPVQEARNKIDWLRDKYTAQDVIFFATDTVSKVSTSEENLGKPVNLWKRLGGPRENLEGFLAEYKKRYYPVGTKLSHLSGTVVVRSRRGEIFTNEDIETEVTLTAQVTEDAFPNIIISPDTGGGGVLQQLYDWNERVIDQVSDEEMKNVLAQEPLGVREWLLFCHIAGVPFWVIQESLLQMARESVEYEERVYA